MAFEDSDIYQAILDGDLAALGCSVREQDVNLRDRSGKSYLHICIELGQKDLVEYLAQKVFLGFRDDNGHTALDLAVRYQMIDVEHQLIRRVAGMQDSDDTQTLLKLFQTGWNAWPPIQSRDNNNETHLTQGYHCQMEILRLQVQVERIHQAVHHGQLGQLQEAVTEEELVLVCDYTGLPPLQKAVVFERLSTVQYLSRGFPSCVNHPDHMGRTALHYAAAYHEYQDNILYKQLLRAGAHEDASDLQGFKPVDFLMDASLLSIDHMREEIKSRLSRPPKDYSSHLSFEESRSLLPTFKQSDRNRNIKRWKAIASVASFANNSHRNMTRSTTFEETPMYESIITNDAYGVRYLLSSGEDVNQLSLEGWSYLHLAVAYNVSPALLSLLLTHLSPAQRDCDGLTPLELTMLTYKNSALTKMFLDVIIGRILAGDVLALKVLLQDGWQYWPDEDYVDKYLQPHLTPHMQHFLSTAPQFMNDVRDMHMAAILHQEMNSSLYPLLDTEAGVSSLDSAGLSLIHICVIFYNIKLLTQLLQNFPFTANLKDNAGRTPLHYAACLDDDEYMVTLLKAAKSRDDEEDLWGMRPGDCTVEGKTLVSPTIQEMIRDKVYHPVILQPLWPTCLLSATMESSKVSEAIKTNDLKALERLLADPGTNFTQRNCQGQSYLHQALLTGTDLPMLNILLDNVDIAVRDDICNTIMELIQSGFHPEGVKQAVEGKVRELILSGGEYAEKETQRLLLSGWSNWPVSAQDMSTGTAHLLDMIIQLKDEITAVHSAVYEGRLHDVQELLVNQQLATAADQTGLIPLHKAVLFKHTQLVFYFIGDFKNILNTKDHMGRTALHYAAVLTDGNSLYKILMEAGADQSATDIMGKTPKDYQQQSDMLPINAIVKRSKDLLDTAAMTSKQDKKATIEEDAVDSTSRNTGNVSVPATEALPLSQKASKQEPKASMDKNAWHCTDRQAPLSTTANGQYIAQHLGRVLTLALAEIVEKQPSDPIEYLAQWLYMYHKNKTKMVQM